ncbi:hypothetical protein LGL55_10660 [Clostridium tagluense]|uniref:hypothetical protein n=1 Tax=Clostridium tagluense TaxID=360422 RepID=UPI001CF2F16F|nr:hypothetical protein [Clostridium tagluense]MCB2311599.1 hypothetical protein [Clostridium tagluense]MCB2316323.1 hypothetical protein [Clostridium tagluense]MCB2321293.1 hypothetical protein [Clostridium tagluense]MCB2326192.1 hypothetical protein [Clostridium tagluense]MCB2331029.1 hypothetical protein [Clostridium tagluense]
MGDTIKIKKGLKLNRPVLALSELTCDNDTGNERLVYGGINGAVEFPNMKDIENIKTELEDIIAYNPINPENYTGTDYNKLQLAFDDAIVLNRPLFIVKNYNIGVNTIVLNKPNSDTIRLPLYVYGGGKIIKDATGFMFTASQPLTCDIYFNNIKFEGIDTVQVSVFDCSNHMLLRVSTNGCFFKNVHNIYFSSTFVQSIKMTNDTVTKCLNAVFDIQGCYNVLVSNMLMETCGGSLVKHSGIGIGYSDTCLNNFTVKDCCIENLMSPVMSIKNNASLLITGNYFESLWYGGIIFDPTATCTNVCIENNHHEGGVDTTSLIKWGGHLQNCTSSNNRSSIMPIHDTVNVIDGMIDSAHDSGALLTNGLDSKFISYRDAEFESNMIGNETFINILKDGSMETLMQWGATNGIATLKSDKPFKGTSYIRIVGNDVTNNCFLRTPISDKFNILASKYMVYFASKSPSLEPFQAVIQDTTSGSGWGSASFYPKKINEWEIFCGEIAILNPNAGGTNYNLTLYPKNNWNSISSTRDFDSIALYEINTSYNPKYFAKAIGYSIAKVGIGYDKLDANGDGIADFPVFTTATRPLLSASTLFFIGLDTTLSKPIWWNGANWKDFMTGATV